MASAFHAYLSNSVSNVTGDGTNYLVLWDAERFDVNNDYDTSTGKFVAPAAGQYRFSCAVRGYNMSSSNNSFEVQIVAAGVAYDLVMVDPASCCEKASGNNSLNLGGSILVDLAQNDEVYVNFCVTNSSKVVGVIGLSFSHFCGELVQ